MRLFIYSGLPDRMPEEPFFSLLRLLLQKSWEVFLDGQLFEFAMKNGRKWDNIGRIDSPEQLRETGLISASVWVAMAQCSSLSPGSETVRYPSWAST
jgi:hypothetical protein